MLEPRIKAAVDTKVSAGNYAAVSAAAFGNISGAAAAAVFSKPSRRVCATACAAAYKVVSAKVYATVSAAACAALLVAWLSGPVLAQGEGLAIRLTSNARPAFETAQSSIALQGTAVAEGGLANIHWVNQFEERGRGTWVAGAQRTATWTVSDIPLHPGINLLTVTAVDAANRSATLQLAVNRKPAPDALPQRPRKIGAGTWQGRPIVYQVSNGRQVVEGDIVLDPEALAKALGPAQSTNGAINPDGFGLSYTAQLWPIEGGVHVVPYVRSDANNPNQTLSNAISDFNTAFAGVIQFMPHNGETDYVSITVDSSFFPGEGQSNVGISSVQPNVLECSDVCTEATWLHEMGHTVGLMHEHQRPDRDTYITLNLANADLPNVPGNFTLFAFDDQTIGLYDYASVMHYGAFTFSKAGLPVLESVPAGIPLGNATGYSLGDIDQIERLYGAVPSLVTVTTNPSGLDIIVDGMTYTAPQTFSWALHETHTLNLPADPQLTTPADGSSYGFGDWNDKKARSHTITVAPGAGTLTAPASAPAVTVYEANFIRYQPFAYLSPAAYPSGSGAVKAVPAPLAKFGGSFYADRTLVKLTLTKNTGYAFYDWYNLPFPPSDNPKSFYIQAPQTEAQAVLVPTTGAGATSVTIVGESLTGPNTWNAGLAGSVDGAFTYLPSGFTSTYYPYWVGGSKHSVSVDQTQSPVTTNVYYNFNSWSDGGAITHTINHPKTGAQNITASFTPFYASYTTANGYCNPMTNSLSVTTSPAGVVYPDDIFLFYEDGTAVTTTATATDPQMSFAGWSGSLTGNANPTPATPIDDQFVPIANFNLAAADGVPLTITSLSPATATARATGLTLTINGSGFIAGNKNTYVYWNGAYRAHKFVSSTELTVPLQPGDLAIPGGQDLQVDNFTTDGQCSVYSEASFIVKEAP
jgi:hypothetical protein